VALGSSVAWTSGSLVVISLISVDSCPMLRVNRWTISSTSELVVVSTSPGVVFLSSSVSGKVESAAIVVVTSNTAVVSSEIVVSGLEGRVGCWVVVVVVVVAVVVVVVVLVVVVVDVVVLVVVVVVVVVVDVVVVVVMVVVLVVVLFVDVDVIVVEMLSVDCGGCVVSAPLMFPFTMSSTVVVITVLTRSSSSSVTALTSSSGWLVGWMGWTISTTSRPSSGFTMFSVGKTMNGVEKATTSNGDSSSGTLGVCPVTADSFTFSVGPTLPSSISTSLVVANSCESSFAALHGFSVGFALFRVFSTKVASLAG